MNVESYGEEIIIFFSELSNIPWFQSRSWKSWNLLRTYNLYYAQVSDSEKRSKMKLFNFKFHSPYWSLWKVW